MTPSSPRSTDNTIFYAPRSAPNTPRWAQSYEFDPYSPSVNDPPSVDAPLLSNRRQTTSVPAPGGPRPFRPQSANKPQYLPLQYSNYDSYGDDKNKSQRPLSAVSDDTFLNTPSPSFFPRRPEYQRSRKHPFSSAYEPPDWKLLIIHVLLCLLAYPIMMVFVLIARDKTLFWTRLVVGMACGVVGVTLGLSLINLGRALLEAATWATLIHQSHDAAQPGVRLRDLAAVSEDSSSAWTAVRVLRTRWSYSGTARHKRSGYDPRFWSLYVIYFLFLVMVAACLTFILGRIVGITTSVNHQYVHYREVLVKGDLSEADLSRADVLKQEFQVFDITWTLSPFSEHGSHPQSVTFNWEGEPVYFSESVRSQFLPGGNGYGTLEGNISTPAVETANSTMPNGRSPTNVEPGALIRYPRWGIRIHCLKADNPANIVPRSANNMTYLFTPRETLRQLFSHFKKDLPDVLEKPFNVTKGLGTDVVQGVNFDAIAHRAMFYDNGVAHSFMSTPISMGLAGDGFVTLEAVLVRLNTSYTPNGKFLRLSDASIPDASGQQTHIGYDGAMCLELYEPYVVETYNSTFGFPSSTKIVSKTSQVTDATGFEEMKGDRSTLTNRALNSTRMPGIYEVAHQNSVNQLLKDNGRDSYYVPSPTIMTFSSSSGDGGRPSRGYTELSPDLFAQARAVADATNVLPYFAGSGDIVGRSFQDQVLSSAVINWPLMVAFVVSVMGLGLVAGLFVPKLPLGVTRRGFHIYSWLAAFHGGEVASDIQRAGLEKNMDLKEMERRLGDIRFRYVV